MPFSKPKRRKLDQYLEGKKKDPDVALTEMTRLSNRVWRLLIGMLLTSVFIGFLFPFSDWRQLVCLGILVFLMNGLGWMALLQIQPRLFDRPSSFNQFILLLLVTVGASKAIFLLGWSPYLVPIPVLAMILTMIFGQAVAVLVSIGVGFYVSLMSPRLAEINTVMLSDSIEGTFERVPDLPGFQQVLEPVLARADFSLGVCTIVGAMIAVILFKRVRQQSQPTVVGGVVGMGQGTVVIAFQFVNIDLRVVDPGVSYLDLHWDWFGKFFLNPSWAVAGGIFSGMLMTVFLPLIERAFGIITERRLLALSDPTNELLHTLRNRAPGTYQHTLGVAQLSANAAEAIGADALLTQVGAYYHDIGKIVKPEYFVENMGEDKSIHSRLRPSMSKLIIISHVKEGIELALEAKLPQRIVDMVPMHHGTTVVEYFFHKAKEMGDSEKARETDSEYRYPGPRPRFPEAGILMLADAVEATAKSIIEPNVNRFQDLVREITQKRLLDGQLDECGLTIKDLRRIEDSFVRTLTTMYHGRIRYPTDEEKVEDIEEAQGNGNESNGSNGESRKDRTKSRSGGAPNGSKGESGRAKPVVTQERA